jgi:DNA-binding response OmpR family regulator
MEPLSILSLPAQAYRDDHLAVDFDHRLAVLDSQRMVLTRKEYDLLEMLVKHAGEIVPRNVLLLSVWGYGVGIRTRTLDVHVRRVRKKLGAHAERYIETIFGIGYRFQPFRAARAIHEALGAPAMALGA